MLLKKYIYHYYPKGIKDVNSEAYLSSAEHRNFCNVIHYVQENMPFQSLKEQLVSFMVTIEGLNAKFLDVTNFNFNDRAFNFQYRFEDSNKIVKTVCCNISILLPVYCIYYLERDFSNVQIGKKADDDFFKYDFDFSPNAYNILNSKISNVLDENGLAQIESSLLNKIVPEIAFNNIGYNKMTVFNCLFLDEPYVSP